MGCFLPSWEENICVSQFEHDVFKMARLREVHHQYSSVVEESGKDDIRLVSADRESAAEPSLLDVCTFLCN